MESKRGILAVLIILSALFLVVGIVFGVCFAIGLTDLFDNTEVWLYLCVGSIGIFVLSALGAIIARNSIITADNTYDILCRIDAILKEKGLTDADIARRDLKRAEKIAKKEAALKAKLEAKALKDILAEERRAEVAARKAEESKPHEQQEEIAQDVSEAIIDSIIDEIDVSDVAVDEVSVSEDNVDVPSEVVDEIAIAPEEDASIDAVEEIPVDSEEEIPAEVMEEIPVEPIDELHVETVEEVNEPEISEENVAPAEVNEEVIEANEVKDENNEIEQPISYEDWKKKLDGKIVCGECGGNVRAYKTKSGQIVLSCVKARKEPDKCSSNKKVQIEQLNDRFVAFYNEFFDEYIKSFDFELFDSKIEKTEVIDGEIKFTAKID